MIFRRGRADRSFNVRSNAMCPQESELVRLVAGELAEGPRARVEAHVAGCAGCQARLAALRETWDVLGAWSAADGSGDLAPAVLAAVAGPRRSAVPWRLAAAVALAVGVGAIAGGVVPLGRPAIRTGAASADDVVRSLGLDELGGMGGVADSVFDAQPVERETGRTS